MNRHAYDRLPISADICYKSSTPDECNTFGSAFDDHHQRVRYGDIEYVNGVQGTVHAHVPEAWLIVNRYDGIYGRGFAIFRRIDELHAARYIYLPAGLRGGYYNDKNV